MVTAKAHFRLLSRVCMALSFLAVSSSADTLLSPFWASKIDSALCARDSYYIKIFPDTASFSIARLNKIQLSEMCERLASAPDTSNPWYNFLCGILQCNQEKLASSIYFATAITQSQQNPGTIWALFAEFTRNGQPTWAERCLIHLEKLSLASGVRAVPAIGQQLLYYAVLLEKQKDFSGSFNYYRWAERFDPNQPWSMVHRLRNYFPMHLDLFYSSSNELIKNILKSWKLQLPFAMHLYTWISLFCIVFMLAIFTGIGLRHFPEAVHPLADRLPGDIPLFLKTLLPICMICSLLSFGVVPFLWFLVFLLWRFLDKNEKVFAFLALIILVCAPIDVRIRDMFREARIPQGMLSQYQRASDEGYSPELYQRIREKIAVSRPDGLSQLSASLCAMKQGDTATARLSVNNALSLRPDDPAILLQAGNIAYMENDLKSAALFFSKIISQHPQHKEALFNLAQCYAQKSDTTLDMDFLKNLGPDAANKVNDFINTNDVYFSKKWPMFRQLMPSEYPSGYFWRNVFPTQNGTWKTAAHLWGASFFGIPPLQTLILSSILLLLLIAWIIASILQKNKQPHLTCRLCKRRICKHCKKGELCQPCFQATKFIRNVKTLAVIQEKIVQSRQISENMVTAALDIVLPGSGMLFSNKHSPVLIFFVVAATCAVYATFFLLSNIHLNYPHWAALGGTERFLYFFGIYNLIFICRAVIAAFRKKETELI